MFKPRCLAALCFVLLGAPLSLHAVVKMSGSLAQDAIWTKAAGPYLVQGDLTIEAGVTLTLEPGVVVYVLPTAGGEKGRHSTASTDIIVKGALEARGTAAAPINFTSAQKDKSWGAICFYGSKQQSSLEYCWVAAGGIFCEDASPFLVSCGLTKCAFAMMLYGKSHPRVTKTRIIGNRSGIYLYDRTCSLSLTNSEVRGNGYGLVLRGFTELEIKSDRFLANQLSVVNMSVQPADLSGNFWGSEEEVSIAKAIHDGADDPKLGKVAFLPLFGQSAVEAKAVTELKREEEQEAGKKMDVAIADWDYAVPTAGMKLFADPPAQGRRVWWKAGVVAFTAAAAAGLLLLL